MTLEDIKRFRQLDSKCPGHPEYRWTSGVETTTGPLGQGVATSVGMAIASKWMAAQFNRPGFEMFGFNVYALCGDGCLMEGISGEAASLAGHLRLDNLCWIYDNNHITIEGPTRLAFSEDVATRFIGYGWNVTRVGDANDLAMLDRAYATFLATKDRPTLIIVDSHIGYGAPTSRTRTPPTASRSERTRSGSPRGSTAGRRTRSSSCPRACASTSRRGSGRGGEAARGMDGALRSLQGEAPRGSGRAATGCSTASCPKAGTRSIPAFPADAKGLAGRDASARC